MKISPQRKIALFLAALILLSGALLWLVPSTPPPKYEESAGEAQIFENPGESTHTGTPGFGADYGMMLIKMIVAVALVCLLAYAILRWGVGRIAGARAGGEEMQILGRLPLAPNRTILVVQIGPRFLVLGNTETEISLLSELSEESAKKYFLGQVPEN